MTDVELVTKLEDSIQNAFDLAKLLYSAVDNAKIDKKNLKKDFGDLDINKTFAPAFQIGTVCRTWDINYPGAYIYCGYIYYGITRKGRHKFARLNEKGCVYIKPKYIGAWLTEKDFYSND